MKLVNLNELVANPLAVTSSVKAGEEITLVENGKELARIVPISRERKVPRPIGLAKGRFEVPDDFNSPLPEEIIRGFEGR